MSAVKPRTRLYYAGKATYRLLTPDKGWGGPYGQNRQPARWACVDCGRTIRGEDSGPWIDTDWAGKPIDKCQRNGHAPCRLCGKPLPRLDDGCPREHNWRACPGKTEADRMQPQHADNHHHGRQP